jgi:hypothetical protein
VSTNSADNAVGFINTNKEAFMANFVETQSHRDILVAVLYIWDFPNTKYELVASLPEWNIRGRQ